MKERRLARVAISQEFLVEMLREGYEQIRPMRVVKGVPKDAQLITGYFDYSTMIGYIVFEHEEFEPVQPGSEIPIIDIHIKTWYDPEAEEIYKKVMAKE